MDINKTKKKQRIATMIWGLSFLPWLIITIIQETCELSDALKEVYVVCAVLTTLSFVFSTIYDISLDKQRKRLKEKLTCEFKKVKIDVDDCEQFSKALLDNKNIETFAKLRTETLNDEKILVKVVFFGTDEQGRPGKVSRICEFKRYEIDFISVE